MIDNPIPAIVGPTGSGKTEIGYAVCRKFDWELISADSRQIYTFMDIGTAKPPPDQVPKIHMIDIVEPDQVYSAGDFGRDAGKLIEKFGRTGRKCLLVGGSGLYLRALFNPFAELPGDPALRARLKNESQPVLYERLKTVDPETAGRLHPHDHQRTCRALEVYELTGITLAAHYRSQPQPLFKPVYIGLDLPRHELYRRIEKRFETMLETGLLDEVKNLKARGYTRDLYAFNALGYRQMFDFIEGRMEFDKAVREAKRKTKEYAKRQLTWFRHTEGVKWVESGNLEETVGKVIEIINNAKIKMQNKK